MQNTTTVVVLCFAACLVSWVGCGEDAQYRPSPLSGEPVEGEPDTPVESRVPGQGFQPITLDIGGEAALVDVSGMSTPSPELLNHPERYAPWASSRAMAVHGDALFVVDEANNALVVLDRFEGSVTREFVLPDRPRHVVVGPDGTAWVTSQTAGTVSRIAAGATTIDTTAEVGLSPIGMALSPDDKMLFVAVLGDRRLMVLDADTLTRLGHVELEGAGGRTVVALERSGSVDVVVAGKRGAVEELTFTREGNDVNTTRMGFSPLRVEVPYQDVVVRFFPSDMFANAVLGAALQPDQEALMLAHQISFTGMEDVALFTAEITAGLTEEEIEEMGGLPGGYGLGDVEEGQVPPQSHEPAVTVLKNGVASSQWGGQLDDRGQPLARAIALPSDINHHPRWAMAAVAGKASDTVVLFNTAEADPMQHVLAVIATQSAPVAVAFSEDGRYLYVQHSNQFTVGVVDVWELLGADTTGQFRARTTSVPISYTALPKAVVYGVDPMSETERAGRRAFTFTRTDGLSQGGAMSCEMCHIEGTEDGLVWFTNDGPRQTPLLADRVPGTEPFNWVGSEAGIVDNMVETVERMGGEGLDSAMMDSIEGFMHLMPGPTLADAHQSRALNALEQEGQALFFDATVGCGSCHSGTHTTDGKNYDVGTSTWVEQELQNIRASFGQIDSVDPPLYNTPSLKGLRYTSPYLHDGSASTLMEVLERTATTMGRTDHLTTRQRQALVAYLLTL